MNTRPRKISDITGYKSTLPDAKSKTDFEYGKVKFYVDEEENRQIKSMFVNQLENISRKRIQSDPEYSFTQNALCQKNAYFRKYSDTSDTMRYKPSALMKRRRQSDSENLKENSMTNIASTTFGKQRRRSSADNPVFSSTWKNPRRSNEKVCPPETIHEKILNQINNPNSPGKAFSKTRSAQNLGALIQRKSKAQLIGKPTKSGKILRRVQSERFIQPVWKDRWLPLIRFRKAVRMIQLLLRATLSSRPPQRNDVKFLSWAHYQDEIMSSKRSYEMIGLSFDPSNYRAKKEVSLSSEAKNILTMNPRDRTKEQLKTALLALNQTVEAFGEFPITMQKSLVRVGWYEHFEDKRVIIRQGHMADNFYFILSGTAIVTKLETDNQTGEEVIRTVAVLKKGNSFGELALMHGAKRSATVTCKEEVELLAVGREDFIDVFMPIHSKQEPEHIRFLRSIDMFCGWPIEKLPYHDPKTCCFTYFRRGLLLCKDSNTSEWVYIVKTGSCRVLKSLYCTKPNIKGLKSNNTYRQNQIHLPPINSPNSTTTSSTLSTDDLSLLQHTLQTHEKRKRRKNHYTLGYLQNILSKPVKEIESVSLEHKQTIDQLLKSKNENVNTYYKLSKRREQEEMHAVSNSEKLPKVYVQIQKLGPKDTYGIEQVAFGMIGNTTSTILVSDGAECILINKKFFQQHLTDNAAKDIRRTYQPLPSEESLQQKLQDQTNWDAFKSMTVVKYMDNRQQMLDSLIL